MGNTADTANAFIGEKAMKIIDFLGQIQTLWGLLCAIVLILAFIYALSAFRRSVNKRTNSQIQKFIRVKKYEPSLYIELNRNLDCLRYFIFAHKWKFRIVKAYNKLFDGYDGKK